MRRKLNAPSQTLWLIAVILGGLGIVSRYVVISGITPYSFSLLAIGFVILVVATLTRGV
jgi:energy-converting hydrogenase Eha subunit C